ncbi:MAG: hypothetical protein IJZ39_01450 [Oscillospiraceae bacterium]|nr:hypothetical protein [Oscillospiraceae bacterium]
MKKSNFDEMQEQRMLQIEHTGYWLAYVALLAVIVIQAILWGDISTLIGELIVVLVICTHMVACCLRHGLWDRQLKPNWQTNLLVSLIGSVVVALTVYFMASRRTDHQPVILICTIASSAVTFILCFAALTICARIYNKRRQELEDE